MAYATRPRATMLGRALAALLLATTMLGRVYEAEALTYVALGDSVAVGVGDGGGGGYVARYRGDLAADLALPIALQNLGVSGSTSSDLLTSLTGDSAVRDAVVAADVLTLDIGGNDLLQAIFAFKSGTCGGTDGLDCFRQAVAGFDANWPAILGELRTLNPGAMMRTITYYNPLIVDLEPGDGTAAALKPYGQALNTTIRTVAPSFGIAVADGLAALNGPHGTDDPIPKGYIDADHIHPSPLGYDLLGEAFHALGYTPMPGTVIRIPSSLTLRDDAVPPLDPMKRRISFSASTKKRTAPANRVVPPYDGAPADPRNGGALVAVYNGAGLTTDRALITLPAGGWTLSGTTFHFSGTNPLTRALIAPDKIKLKAEGSGLDYSLDETAQGTVALRVTLGGGAWCAAAPAKMSGAPPSTAASDRPGKFVGERNAAPPATCPPDPAATPSPTPSSGATSTATPTTTPTPMSCGSACGPCGSCGDGFCALASPSTGCTHEGASDVCFSNGTCFLASCAADGDCGTGKVCVHTGATVCCSVCP